MGTIETYQLTNTKLKRITWLSEQDSEKEFHCLMHLFNEESLTECFHELDAKKAVGIDGVNKWLNRRSQRKSFNWEKFTLFIDRYPLPKIKIVHRLF